MSRALDPMALAIIQPSPFDILPAPPVRARHLRNQRKLQRLAASPGQQALWEDEVARQLDLEGFAQLDDLLGAAASSQLHEVVMSSLEAAAGAGGLSGGGAASILRGDRTAWANRSSVALDGLLSRLDGLVSRGLGPRLPEASDLGLRSDAQFSVYPANGTRYGALHKLPRCALASAHPLGLPWSHSAPRGQHVQRRPRPAVQRPKALVRLPTPPPLISL